jgi:streptogramin lyase
MRQNPAVPRSALTRSRAVLAAVLSLLLLVSGTAVAQAAVGQATLYGTPSAGPYGADATGPEGDVWVIAGHTGTEAVLERFAADGTESEEPVKVTIPSGDVPVSIAPGPEGTMWLALQGTPTGEILQVERTGAVKAEATLPTENEPTQIATDPSGDLYVAEKGKSPQIGKRLEPAGALTEFATLTGDEPVALAPTGTGDVWVSDATLPGVRLVAEGKEAFSETLPEAPRSLTVQGESVWFGVGGLTPAIDRLTEAHVPLESFTEGLETGDEPRAISAAPDGNVWFAVEHPGAPALGRITPSGAISKFPLASVRSFGLTIAVGADKRLWLGVEGETAEWQLAAVTVLEPGKEPPTEPTPPAPKGPVASGSLGVGPAVVFAAGHATCSGVSFWEGTVTTHWLLDGSPIAGATGTTYTPPRAEDGHGLSCSQTATGTDGRSTTVTSPPRTVHEQPAQPAWPIGPAAQHCSSPVCMQDGSGMGETVQSYREGSAWWASRQVRCVSAPWTSIVGDSTQSTIRSFAEARSITIAVQRMTATGPVTVAGQTFEGLGAARDPPVRTARTVEHRLPVGCREARLAGTRRRAGPVRRQLLRGRGPLPAADLHADGR